MIMSFSISGTGSAYPALTLTNDALSGLIDTSDEWISSRTGIRQRHVLSEESLADLAVTAAEQALVDAGVEASELDLILCSTLRGDFITPSLSCIVEKRLGACCPAYDLNAACSGFIYALDAADGYFARRKVKKVLVVAAEAMSKLVDWQDRSTCILFGDGAGAVVLSEGEDLLSIKLSANGDTDVMAIPNVSGNFPEAAGGADPYLTMRGQEVFKFAVSSMCRDLAEVIDEAGLTRDEISYVLPHQANLRIIDAARNRLKIPPGRILTNIERFGNTSSASIPLLLDEMNRKGRFQKGDILALSAFGSGFTTGACILRWSRGQDESRTRRLSLAGD